MKKRDALPTVGEAFGLWMVPTNPVGSRFEKLSSIGLLGRVDDCGPGIESRFLGDNNARQESGLKAHVSPRVGDMASKNSRPHLALGLLQKCNGSPLERLRSQGVASQISNSYNLGLESVAGIKNNDPTILISFSNDKATSLHLNPTFEKHPEAKVGLISNARDPKKHTIVTCFGQNIESLEIYQMTCQGVGVPFYGDLFLSMVTGDDSWKFDLFRLWRATSTGSFSLKSAYEKVCEGTLNLKEWLWAIPLKFYNPHWIHFFIWLALKQCLLTNANRVRCGFGSSSACGLCGHDYKDVLHILRDCNAARGIWDKLIPQQDLSVFYSRSLLDQMRNNFQSHFSSWDGTDWPCLFEIIMWRIWKNQNLFDEGFAADGGCVRDHNGEWIIGFAKYLGNCTVLETELWGILNELNLILDRRFEKILIQIDSIEAINVILEDSSRNSNSALVRKIHLILRKMEQ
ncbi:hypothetical protein Gohar_013706 [Gossypium harknessii]|uniref:Reverse transcriptase n=1 Tax=Gossypium harknessii TaxID=34285 RepID=A0A7J9H0Z5_9ROSI|nr:hypothetical protein [Gossypium harknessii]